MTNRSYRSDDDLLPTRGVRAGLRRRRSAAGTNARRHLRFGIAVALVVLAGVGLSLLSFTRVDGSIVSSLIGDITPGGSPTPATTAPVVLVDAAPVTPTTTVAPAASTPATTSTTIKTSSTFVERAATDRFRVANVAPQIRLTHDLESGGQPGVELVGVQIADGNTMVGARIELCIHRANAACDDAQHAGVRAARWTIVVTNAAPVVTEGPGNRDWRLELVARTGGATTQTATYEFDLRTGRDTEAGSDWVLAATVFDDAGNTATAVGAPKTFGRVGPMANASLTEAVVNTIWPF